jgi:hypothetical protein
MCVSRMSAVPNQSVAESTEQATGQKDTPGTEVSTDPSAPPTVEVQLQPPEGRAGSAGGGASSQRSRPGSASQPQSVTARSGSGAKESRNGHSSTKPGPIPASYPSSTSSLHSHHTSSEDLSAHEGGGKRTNKAQSVSDGDDGGKGTDDGSGREGSEVSKKRAVMFQSDLKDSFQEDADDKALVSQDESCAGTVVKLHLHPHTALLSD